MTKKEIEVERIIRVGEFISGLRIKNKAPGFLEYIVLPMQRVFGYLDAGYNFIYNDKKITGVKAINPKKNYLVIG
ncbi:MAG TPA: hypothetical protein VF220_02975 [Nitrososphaeraceae archaeon]